MGKYECGFCGKKFNAVQERMDCETRCERKNAERVAFKEQSRKIEKLDKLVKRRKDILKELDEIDKEISVTKNEIAALSSAVHTSAFTEKRVSDKELYDAILLFINEVI